MSVLTRLICSRIRPNLLFTARQACFPLSTTAGLTSFPKSSGLDPFKCHFQQIRVRQDLTRMACSLNIGRLQPLLQPPLVYVPVRGVVNYSKRRGKKKSVKAVSKRFHRTGSGKLKYWPAGKVHNMLAKSRNHRRRLRKPRYASKTQLKTLNKMISGW